MSRTICAGTIMNMLAKQLLTVSKRLQWNSCFSPESFPVNTEPKQDSDAAGCCFIFILV